jgi:DNA-binding CsgD family transcriptional regulator
MGWTTREAQIMHLLLRGYSNREIAAELGVSERTVKTLLARLYAKLNVRRRAAAVNAWLLRQPHGVDEKGDP